MIVACLFAWQFHASAQEFAVPDGFELQRLRPLGGKMAKPEGWHYIERHEGPKYSWIISQEPLDKNPALTGARIQLFNGVKKGTGKLPSEFCKEFLKGCEKRGSEHIVIPESESGIFHRAGVQMLESLEVKEKKVENRVIYFTFWHDESDVAAMMSLGCRTEEWEKLAPTLNVMAKVQLFDMDRYVKDGKVTGLPVNQVDGPSKRQAVGAAEKLLADPLAVDTAAQLNIITRFAELSSEVQVDVNIEFFPWMKTDPKADNGPILFGSFIAGNMKPQLAKKEKADHSLEGLRSLLGVYEKLRAKNEFMEVAQYEQWLKLDEKELKAFVEKVRSRAGKLEG